jgi:hypothetical protein
MTEQVEFIEHFIDKHTFSVINPRTLQETVMSSVGGILIGQIQPHTFHRFNLWAPTRAMNTEGGNASSFEVPDQIQGLGQYLEVMKPRYT